MVTSDEPPPVVPLVQGGQLYSTLQSQVTRRRPLTRTLLIHQNKLARTHQGLGIQRPLVLT